MAAEAAKAEIAWKGKSSRLCKQYLVHILMELHQPTGGEELGEKEIYRKGKRLLTGLCIYGRC